MEKHRFWQSIRAIAQADDSVEVPQASLDAAFAIFQPKIKERRFFQLQPSFAGAVRRANVAERLVFKCEDQFVQLEQDLEGEGVSISGFISEAGQTKVTLFGDESVFSSNINEGEFEFNSIPSGCYDMAFDNEGESLWIPNINLGETKE